ncbi:alpha/beta hydrolase [Litchfieldella xinjiangensis]|uniref:alpha/beta hydrolase n=1 Tax=Litchfieldella xinjiangensis TaxID=1166948 RepID=UPI000693FAAF|nr:alpha/beta hydrolase-fold protein [Halomonas xinjiangensis]
MGLRRILSCLSFFVLLHAGSAAAGQVSHHTFDSDVLGRPYPYTLYLPDGYAISNLEYPVVYLLHGSFGSAYDWTHKGRLKPTVDRMIAAGRIPPAIFVMPGSQSWWVDGHNERARTAFLEELIPHIEATWHVAAERAWRGIGGLSAGGYGTINFVMERPDLFAAAAALSPASYHPLPPRTSSAWRHPAFSGEDGEFDADLWRALNYPARLDGYLDQSHVVPLYLSAGNRDRHKAVAHAERLYEALHPHQSGELALQVLRGGHTWRVWRSSLPAALDFMFGYLKPPREMRVEASPTVSTPPQ